MSKEVTKAPAGKPVYEAVAGRIQQLAEGGKLDLPTDYSAPNAIMAAWLTIQQTVDKNNRPALEVCTRESIMNAMLDMVVQALTPVRNQCYFVVYGDKLVLMPSYMGQESLLRRVYPGAQVFREVIWRDDDVEIEITHGQKRIASHKTKFANIGGLDEIAGAYAYAVDRDGKILGCEVMTIEQIKAAWRRGKVYQDNKTSTPHAQHPEQMSRKTVVRRLCWRLVSATDDAYLREAIERQQYLAAESEIEAEVAEQANQTLVEIPAGTTTGVNQKPAQQETTGALEQSLTPDILFAELCEEHGIDPKQGRKLASKLCGYKDVIELTHDDYRIIVDDPDKFVEIAKGNGKGGNLPGF